MMDHEPQDMMKCPDCEHICEPGDVVTLYECGNCGTVFGQDGSADGASHRCPDCNKFASKKTDDGCPECTEGEMEPVKAHEEDGEWVEDVLSVPADVQPVPAVDPQYALAKSAFRIVKQYVDSAEAKPISRAQAGSELEGQYGAVESLLDGLEDGSIPSVRTPLAFYKSVPASEAPPSRRD